jgi:hypothetical protein
MLLVTLWLPCRGTYEIVQSIGRFFMMASRYLKPCESVRVCVESGKGMPSCVRVGKTLSRKVILDILGIVREVCIRYWVLIARGGHARKMELLHYIAADLRNGNTNYSKTG